MLKRAAVPFLVAVVALVVSLATPAGALAPASTTGKFIIKNRSRSTIHVSPSYDPEFYTLAPNGTLVIRGAGLYDNIDLDFDGDGDSVIDATYGVTLNGAHVGKFAVGDFGIFSITTQQ